MGRSGVQRCAPGWVVWRSCFEGCFVSDWVRLRSVTEEKAVESRGSSNGRPPTRPEWGPRRAVTALDGEEMRWGRDIDS